MLKKEDIDHLAELARIKLSEEEKADFAGQLDSVLAYVGEIQKVATDAEATPRAGDLRNVMRKDGDPYAGGEFSAAILENAPQKKDGYFKVEQIF